MLDRMSGVLRFLAMCSVVLAACGDNDKASESIGGNVSGLAGTGLVLHNSNGEELAITGNGAFHFPTKLAFGAAYEVTVATQPTAPTQMCVVANGGGKIDADAPVEDVAVTCSKTAFTVGGTVSGLSGSGLVLQNNGGDDLAISADGSFTFATTVESGAAFHVTVKSQPTGPSSIARSIGSPSAARSPASPARSCSRTTEATTSPSHRTATSRSRRPSPAARPTR